MKNEDKAFRFENNLFSSVGVNDDKSNEGSQNSHLFQQDKKIVLRIALVSDTEGFWNNVKEALQIAQKRDVAFVIHLGDITHLGVPEKLAEAKKVFSDTGMTVYPVPGDRDLWKSRQTQNGITAFSKVFGDNYRLVEEKNLKFLLIDNANIYEGIDEKQWQFIKENIGGVDFVFLHNPIFFSKSFLLGNKGMGQYSADVDIQRQELLSLIRSKGVKAVFAGNQHLFSETADDKKPELNHYVIGSLNPERNLQLPNFAILTIYGDGDYWVEQVNL